ncbi:hypothetical protein [Paragemmobacter ruber]|uniref:Uncharacterized protein n=1 Tax=Paragemmobacter ruber TaxID=1985673 RepID=A0ABW9Y1W5_9RHOB|nr:hypothetical protein [Rhodobacter ruber]NBE05959.1 hypothetical protein [Rhodobacter ruber]
MATTPDNWQPSEERITDLLARFTPRQLAIGYLRAQRRARQEASAFALLDDISLATIAATQGDLNSARQHMEKANRTAATAKQVLE